ncbi:MFS transporter [Novosphingobium lentum]|uniref:MFS transporter n=1 Tax=Novosphingobium lentum TaxID=145287 RepID=UPI00082F1CF2|nr:MFS transporter [Novosphingobium lentum]
MAGVTNVNSRTITKGGWYALTLVGLVQLLSLLDRNILAILAPRIKADLHIGDGEMGLLYGTVFALFYALFSLPLGRLADGWTRTRLLAIAIFFWSLATGVAAFAGGFALLALSRLGVGIGEAASQPAGTSLVFDHFPKPRRGLAMAVLAASIAVGLGLSSVLGGVAAGWWDARYAAGSAPLGFSGWQFAFLVAAIPGLPLAALLWRMREPARGAIDGIPTPADPHPFRASAGVLGAVTPGSHWLALARRGASTREWLVNTAGLTLIVVTMVVLARVGQAYSPRPDLQLGGLSINPHALQWGVIGFGLFVVLNLAQSLKLSDPPAHAVMASPSLVICMAVGSIQSMINYGVMGFTPSFLMKSYHLSPATTGLQFGLLAAGLGIVGPMISGPVSDWMNNRLPGAGRVWVTLASLGLSPLIGLWVYHAADAGTFYMRFTLYSLVLTMWLPPLYAVMYDQVLPRMRGITASTYIIVSTIFGLGIGPYLVGMISDAGGGDLGHAIRTINWVAVPIVVLLVVLGLTVRRDEGRVVERARAAGEGI